MYNRLRNVRSKSNIKCDQNGNSSDVRDIDETVENESNTKELSEDLVFQSEDYLDPSPNQDNIISDDDIIEYDISGSDSSSIQLC